MLIAGIDVAAQAVRTAAVVLEWGGGGPSVAAVEPLVDDAGLRRLIEESDRSGLDVPLGWPEPFVRRVEAHSRGRPGPWSTPRELMYRATDLYAWQATGRPPLSVSTDRIALCALRVARVTEGLPGWEDRSGAGRMIEVYPGGALRSWGLPATGYKGASGAGVRRDLCDRLRRRLHRLRLPDSLWTACAASDHVLDALLAALVARAAVLGLTHPPPAESRELARREGWIALPAPDALERLG